MRSTPKVSRNAVAAVFFLSWPLASIVARAEPADPAKAQAQARLREGNALLGEGRATDALMKFTEAYRSFPSPKLHYNLGQAHSLIPGHEAEAYQSMSRFLKEAVDASPELRAAAETRCQQLRPKVGLVSVTSEPADADLLIDEVSVGRVSRDAPTAIAIGTHRLALKKDAAVSTPTTITIAGGETMDVRLRLAPAVMPPPVLPVAPEPAPISPAPAALFPPANLNQAASAPASGSWTWQRKLGAGLAAAGLASLALGVIEHVRYFGKKDDFVSKGCGTEPAFLSSHPDCQGLNDQFKSANTWWVVGYIGAAVLGGTGAYFLWIAPGDASGALAASAPTVNFEGRF